MENMLLTFSSVNKSDSLDKIPRALLIVFLLFVTVSLKILYKRDIPLKSTYKHCFVLELLLNNSFKHIVSKNHAILKCIQVKINNEF